MGYMSGSVTHQNMMYVYGSESYWQGESDGLCKEIMWSVKKWIHMIIEATEQAIM